MRLLFLSDFLSKVLNAVAVTNNPLNNGTFNVWTKSPCQLVPPKLTNVWTKCKGFRNESSRFLFPFLLVFVILPCISGMTTYLTQQLHGICHAGWLKLQHTIGHHLAISWQMKVCTYAKHKNWINNDMNSTDLSPYSPLSFQMGQRTYAVQKLQCSRPLPNIWTLTM